MGGGLLFKLGGQGKLLIRCHVIRAFKEKAHGHGGGGSPEQGNIKS